MKINHKTGEARLSKKEWDSITALERDYTYARTGLELASKFILQEKNLGDEFKAWIEAQKEKPIVGDEIEPIVN
jgi:hypothetical protein